MADAFQAGQGRPPKRSDVPLLALLLAVRSFHKHEGPTPDVALAAAFPEKLVLARMAQIHYWGLIEYGVSLRTSWLTEQGKAALADELRKAGVNHG